MSYTLTLQGIAPVTHDTYMLSFDRPDDFTFEAGQASRLAIQKDGLQDEQRPFTMTSRPDQSHLEFVIKSYPERDGMTKHIPELSPGDQVTATDPVGAITDHGPGVFLAAGAGVTPYIAILRKQQQQEPGTAHLIFANETPDDIILKQMWQSMTNVAETFVVSKGDGPDVQQGRIDAAFLADTVSDTAQPFYVCGPHGFVDDMRDILTDMGVAKEDMIIEEGW